MCWLSVGHMFSFPSSPQGDQGESGETGSDGRPGGKVTALMIIVLNRFPISLDRFIHSLSPILGKMWVKKWAVLKVNLFSRVTKGRKVTQVPLGPQARQ